MKNLGGLMKQAQEMQKKMADMQAKLESTVIDGVSGAGLVRVTLTGKGAVTGIKLDSKVVDPADTEMLEDPIVAALADAKSKLDALAESEMKNATGGLNLPPGMKLPF
jgi:DNA-binding YbaB/EbfC family protein